MKPIKAIVCDLDGTLFPRKVETLSAYTLDVFQRIKALNIPLIIASGRASYFIQDEAIEKLQADYYATINGQLVLDSNLQAIYQNRLDATEIAYLLKACRKHDIMVAVKNSDNMPVYHGYDRFGSIYLKGNFKKASILVDATTWPIDIDPSNAPFGLFMIGDEEKIKMVAQKLTKLVLSHAYAGAMEVFDPTIGKSDGVAYALSQLNLTLNDAIAFGDAHNDINLLEKVGLSVAMENATDDVKAVAQLIAPPCHEDGVAKVLEQLLIKNNASQID